MSSTPTAGARQILAASFSTPDGASRAASAIGGAYPDKLGNAAILTVLPDGTPHFIETKDWGGGRGALLGGAIGIIGGPLGVLAGSAIGAAAAKLRDTGFPDSQLRKLGSTLGVGHSAVVLEIASSALTEGSAMLTTLGATAVVVEDIDQDVSDLFATVPVPQPDVTAS